MLSEKNHSEQLEFIGIVHSQLKSLQDCPLQETENAPAATIEIFDAFADGMRNIQAGDDLILLTWLHVADRTVLWTHPRNDVTAPLTGIFSTRSPDRPNPIGIHSIKVVSVLRGNKLQVSGLEVLDQTPVIDIKPKL